MIDINSKKFETNSSIEGLPSSIGKITLCLLHHRYIFAVHWTAGSKRWYLCLRSIGPHSCVIEYIFKCSRRPIGQQEGMFRRYIFQNVQGENDLIISNFSQFTKNVPNLKSKKTYCKMFQAKRI